MKILIFLLAEISEAYQIKSSDVCQAKTNPYGDLVREQPEVTVFHN